MARHQRTSARCALAAAALFALACGGGDAAPELALIAEPGPWPWVSELVGYGERLWFANSIRSRSHNSADLWSYDPVRGEVRYERHLFSQGLGRPAVWRGLLYWPHEDSRFHLGVGHVSVTDGRRWALRTLWPGTIDHVTALAVEEDALVAATSYVRPALYASHDAGRTWQVRWHAPSLARRRIARISRLTPFGRALYGAWFDGLHVSVERTLVRFPADDEPDAIPDWPRDGGVVSLVAWRDRVYGLVQREGVTTLWRTDGGSAERVRPGPPCSSAVDLAVGPGRLWLLCADAPGGRVWSSPDARSWQLELRLADGTPRDLVVYGGRAYVGGQGASGRGALWGPPPPAPPAAPVSAAASLGGSTAPPGDAAPVETTDPELARALLDPGAYADRAAALTALLFERVRAGAGAAAFAGHLDGPFAAGRVEWLNGLEPVPRAALGRWALLWAMTLAGGGEVPGVDWQRPWTVAPNEREKYLDPLPAELVVLAVGGHASPGTLAALVARLDPAREPADPVWLTGDVVGALTAVTGRRFGYDAAAWRAWWAASGPRDADGS